jgi:hypothetical protein
MRHYFEINWHNLSTLHHLMLVQHDQQDGTPALYWLACGLQGA